MFDKLQIILGRLPNGFETNKLLNWINNKIYTEEEILNAYEYCKVKDINYIQKYLESNKIELPSWYNKKIDDKPLTEKEILKYQEMMKEFYGSEEEWREKTKELLNESKMFYN